MNFKGFIATVLSVVMLMAMMTAVSAGTFPDVLAKHSWAEEYIEDMVSRGLLKGYTDGTFKPDNAISKLEAMILSARILGINNSENAEYAALANSAYEAELKGYDIQYKKEVAYLLYLGVIKPSELSQYIGDNVKNTAMKRYEVAVLIKKVLGGEDTALENSMIILDYKDDSSIPADAKAYVQFISESGIMKGMEDNKFMPMYEVTRAMMATMMYRTENTMDLAAVDANVVSVNSTASTITAVVDGTESVIVLSDDTMIKLDGYDDAITGIKAGYDIRVHYQGEKIRYIEASASKSQFEKTGVIKALSNNGGVLTVAVTPTGSEGEASTTYTLDTDTKIFIDNAETIFSSLKSNMYIRLTVKDGKTVKIIAETKESTVRGTISKIDASGDAPIIYVKLSNGSESNYEIVADTVIMRNSVSDNFRNLAVGDNAELTVTAGRVKRISATSVNKTIEGTIEEIFISSSPYITIKSNGVSVKYKVAESTTFFVEE